MVQFPIRQYFVSFYINWACHKGGVIDISFTILFDLDIINERLALVLNGISDQIIILILSYLVFVVTILFIGFSEYVTVII